MPASFRDRLLAFLYDYVVIAGYLVLLAVVATAVMNVTDSSAWSGFFSSPVRGDLVAFVSAVLPVTLYFALSEGSGAQATWGKRRLGIKVETTRGTRMSLSRSLARSVLKFLPWQMAHTCLFHIPGWPMQPETPPAWVVVGFVVVVVLVFSYLVSIVTSRKNQAFYDRMLGTRVVATSR